MTEGFIGCRYTLIGNVGLQQMENRNYSLTQIADWLLRPKDVCLPVIQRGFVWRPSQIENLWDSIFRDYPIGAFMLTSEGRNKMLLDGQQRATSVALGFYNPWKSDINSMGNAKNLPVLWIDIAPEDKTSSSEFVFRAVTRSHPWGYQIKYNNNILSVNDRRNASMQYAELFGEEIYTQLKPQQRLPYDAYLPMPLCFMWDALLKTDEYEKWRSLILQDCEKHIPEGYRPKHLHGESYHDAMAKVDMAQYLEILRIRLKQYSIPAIIVDNKLIINDTDSTNDPTLFIRLNSAGTRLDGEELIYSIYKAVCPQTKMLVENMGNNLIAPSRIISIASRFILSIKNGRYIPNINLVQFQKAVRDAEFISSMMDLSGTDPEDSKLSLLVNKSISILKGDGSIPDILVKKFIREAPDGLLLLINWLYHTEYLQKDIPSVLAKKICARLYRLYWFGDLEYVIRKTWDRSRALDYWDEEYHNDTYLAQLPLISPDILETFLLERLDDPEENHTIGTQDEPVWSFWTEKFPQNEEISDEAYTETIRNGWADFLYRLFTNKSLVLLAQRNYINREFKEFNQFEDLQDSNTPWDWDHIYPQSWVYYQKSIDDRTRRWEWRTGNLRAMSLTDNRSENNNQSPATRFKKENEDYFIQSNDLQYWSKLTDEHKNIKKWDQEYVLIHAKAIITRTVNVYRNFLDVIGQD